MLNVYDIGVGKSSPGCGSEKVNRVYTVYFEIDLMEVHGSFEMASKLASVRTDTTSRSVRGTHQAD
jgi:hypothetical protein